MAEFSWSYWYNSGWEVIMGLLYQLGIVDHHNRQTDPQWQERERKPLKVENENLMQRLTFPFPFVHHQSHDWKVEH